MDQEAMTACQTTEACSENPSGLIFPETANELRAAAVTGDCAAVEAILLGLVTPLDGGGGKFFYDPTNTDPDDNATILVSTTVGAWVKHSA